MSTLKKYWSNLKLFYDHRYGSFNDFSSNLKHGVPNSDNFILKRNSLRVHGIGGDNIVSSIAQLAATESECTVILKAKTNTENNENIIFTSNGAVDNRFQVGIQNYLAGNKYLLWEFGDCSGAAPGQIKVAWDNAWNDIWGYFTFRAGFATMDVRMNNVEIAAIATSSTFIKSDNNFNYLYSTSNLEIQYCLIFNKKLSNLELSLIYDELDRFYKNELTGKVIDDSLIVLTGYDTAATRNAKGGTVNMPLSNSVIKFGDAIGRFKVNHEYIGCSPSKVIECTVAGVLYIPMLDGAYGDWEIFINKDAVTNFQLVFVADTIGAKDVVGQDGYYLDIDAAEAVCIGESVAGVATNKITIPAGIISGVWTKIKVIRQLTSDFYIEINGIRNAATFNDATITTSKYICLSMGIGDKLALANMYKNNLIFNRY